LFFSTSTTTTSATLFSFPIAFSPFPLVLLLQFHKILEIKPKNPKTNYKIEKKE